jgi:Ser/Thr protein kinase RdoA (MazF antagonist)
MDLPSGRWAINTRPSISINATAETKTVFEAQAPAFSIREAETIAQRAFDIPASAQPLDSERDQNFRLRTETGGEWVLKIANPAEDPAIVDMQTQASS